MVRSALLRHTVETCLTPAEALMKAATFSYDLVLCDFRMPDMNGIEFYRELSQQRPDLCEVFILMTGLSADPELDQFLRATDVPVLRKPFSLRELRERVAESGGVRSRVHA